MDHSARSAKPTLDHRAGGVMGGLTIHRLERADAPDEVMEQLASQIRGGGLQANDRLPSEKHLAETFGVSRPVVREALRGLRSLGLIVSRSGSGSYVASGGVTLHLPLLLGRYSTLELHEVRTHLEVPGAALAASRATDEQVAELERLVALMPGLQGRRYAELDGEFHTALAACSRNGVLTRLIADLHELIVANSDLALSADADRQAQATVEHRQIAEAVRQRDPAAAEAAMQRHLSRVSQLLQRLGEGNDASVDQTPAT
jgi:GntR family transcriptional regulator, transcriptional repressor for pyruvate dehydrogenase complex